MRLAAAALLLAAISAAQDPLRGEIDRIYADGGYARELPGEEPYQPRAREPEPSTDEEPRDVKTYPPRTPREVVEPAKREPGALSMILGWLPWVAVAAGIVTIAIMALARGRAAPPKRDASPEPAPAAPAPAAAAPALSAAEALAREGRHAEAIHALLLAAIDRVRASSPLAASLTSREFSSAARLDAAGRGAFRELVRAVEITLFGGRAAGRAEFDACAAALERIAP